MYTVYVYIYIYISIKDPQGSAWCHSLTASTAPRVITKKVTTATQSSRAVATAAKSQCHQGIELFAAKD